MKPFRPLLALLCFALPAVADAEQAAVPESVIDHYLRDTDNDPTGLLLAPAEGGVFGLISVQLHAWYPELDGKLTTDGNIIDSGVDLALDDNELTAMPVVTIDILFFGFRLDGYSLKFTGTNQLNRSFTINGTTFQVNERVDSSIRIDNFRFMTVFTIVKAGPVKFALDLGVNTLFVDGTFTGENAGTASRSETLPVPVVGFIVNAKAGPVLFELDVSGMHATYNGDGGTLIDARFMVGFSFLKIVSVHIGYRHVFVDAAIDDWSIDVRLSGFFIGIALSF